jgi:hypothetical protein
MRYILHPAIEINLKTNDNRYISYFENEYRKLSGYKLKKDHTVINVFIVNKLPPVQKKNDRIKKIKFAGIFTHHYLIRDLETLKVDIFYKESIFGKLYAKILTLFLQTQILEPIIYLKLLDHDVLFMHAAGVSDGRYGYLFPAQGGTGKTTLTLGLMCEGMHVLGDDLLLVEPHAKLVYPYLRPLHIFSYNVNTLRGAIVPFSIRGKLAIKDIIRVILETITQQKFLISTRVHAEKLYSSFKASEIVTYEKIIFLKNKGRDEKIKITPQNVKILARQILESEDLNDSLYVNVLEPGEKTHIVDHEIEVISNVLRQVPYFESINVRQLDYKELSGFKQKLVAGYLSDST